MEEVVLYLRAEVAACRQEAGEEAVVALYLREVAEEAASCRHACRILAVEEAEKYRFR